MVKTTYPCKYRGKNNFSSLQEAEEHEKIPINTIPIGLIFHRDHDFCIVNRIEGSEGHDTWYNLLTCLESSKGRVYTLAIARYPSSQIKKGVKEGVFGLMDGENAQESIKRLSFLARDSLRRLGITRLVLDLEGKVEVPLPY